MVGCIHAKLDTLTPSPPMRQNEQSDKLRIGDFAERQIKFNTICARVDLSLHKSMKALNAIWFYEVARQAPHFQHSPKSCDFSPRRPRSDA
jgi:hypothetical protein